MILHDPLGSRTKKHEHQWQEKRRAPGSLRIRGREAKMAGGKGEGRGLPRVSVRWFPSGAWRFPGRQGLNEIKKGHEEDALRLKRGFEKRNEAYKEAQKGARLKFESCTDESARKTRTIIWKPLRCSCHLSHLVAP